MPQSGAVYTTEARGSHSVTFKQEREAVDNLRGDLEDARMRAIVERENVRLEDLELVALDALMICKRCVCSICVREVLVVVASE